MENKGTSINVSSAISQERFLKSVAPIFSTSGKLYKKYTRIYVRQTVKDEKVYTITQDGLETFNIAKEGDFVVKNQTDARELYIINQKKLNERYQLLGRVADGFFEYKPLGKVIGIELTAKLLTELGIQSEFEFFVSWGEKMVAKKGDYIVTPLDYSEVYRIARKEFFETYELDKNYIIK